MRPYNFILKQQLIILFMSSLPMIKKTYTPTLKNTKIDYLHFDNVILSTKRNHSSLQKQAIATINKHKYLYIDFQLRDSLLELQKDEDQKHHLQDDTQQIGNNKIGTFDSLFKISPEGYRMHKFLSEEKLHFSKLARLNRILGKKQVTESALSFQNIRQQINPQKLEDYLENKHNQDQWRKIQQRQKLLYDNFDKNNIRSSSILTTNQNQINVKRRLRTKHDFEAGRVKLKALSKLNNLLEN